MVCLQFIWTMKCEKKAWESIMLKIITGEAATERVVDMVAGQVQYMELTLKI